MNGTLIADGDGAGIFLIIYLAIVILCIVGIWKVFTKAGKPGWAAIVPIYNIIVLLEIVGRPLWWIILFFIPLVSLIIAILVMVDLAKAFGKGVGYAIGMVFLGFIFIPMLGFSDAKYSGPPAH